MRFCEKLKEARTKAGLKQEELAKALGVSLRTITNYESGECYPRKRDIYHKLAELFHTEENYFLNEDEEFLLSAAEKYGAKGAKQAQALVDEVSGLFAGGNIADEDLDVMMKALQDAYWIAKEKNKKFTPKKYRKQLIDSYTQQILLQQAQKENGVTVSDEEVEKAWKDACKSAGGAKAFKKTLKTYGYTEDTGSKEKKGDVGWDKLTTFVDSYQTALEGLNKGDVSEVVESTYGYHVIKCTDYFHVDNQVDDINQVPKAIKKYVSNVVKTQAASTAYSEWLEQYKKDADITVNPMPKNVPYNVSLKGVTKSSTDDSSTTE